MNGSFSRYLPWLVIAGGTVYFILAATPPRDPAGQFQYQEFAALPVVDRGRVKPIDTLARNSLMVINERQDFKDRDGKTQPAIKWLLDIVTTQGIRNSPARDVRAFHVSDPALRAQLGLPARAGFTYSYAELAPHLDAIGERAKGFTGKPPEDWTEQERQFFELAAQLFHFERYAVYETDHPIFRIENDQVLGTMGLQARPGLRYSFSELLPRVGSLVQESLRASRLAPHERDLYQVKLLELAKKFELYVKLANLQTEGLHVVPPRTSGDEWKTYEQARQYRDQDPNSAAFLGILQAYLRNQPDAFNRNVAEYRDQVTKAMPVEMARSDFELFFNHFKPFYHCAMLYVLVFLLACLSFVGFAEPLRRASFWLAVVTLAVHTWALIARMYIQGRPPVTNLYSSAVFIGWGCVVLGLVLEAIYRRGIGNLVAGATGALSLVVAHNLASGGDTLEMMQAVLDTNFWLATHVTCVTIGYTATFVAGFLGIVYVFLGVLTRRLDRDLTRSLSQMIYGVVCFATLFSFTGTVLGGIWADQSWGRFWGWDPKENGALLIVIWNALILHARWAGLARARGLALLAIFGNVVTAWSWFGVNMLGVGLHSYGFMEGAVFWLAAFMASQLLLIGMGLLPPRWWRSFAAQEAAPARLDRKPRGRQPVPLEEVTPS
jgi:ABC-type transport system involved in cytochrome c biogenesis permease subunit